jgi:membrane dipeptidase
MKNGLLSSYWPVIDGHADTLVQTGEEGRSFFCYSTRGHLDLPRLRQTGVDLQVLAICAGKRQHPHAWVEEILDSWEREYQSLPLPARPVWIKNAGDFLRWEREKGTGVILGLEGAEPLEDNLDNLEKLYARGIRILSLTWNHPNAFASGSSAQKDSGLTPLGREAIRLAEKLGILLDLSHLAPKSFREAIFFSNQPAFVSHANIYDLCPHPRNLTAEQIKAVVEKEGVIGLTFYPDFISKKERPGCAEWLSHLRYLLQEAGADYVGLGGDFDGIEKTLFDLREVRDLPHLVNMMAAEGLTGKAIAKVLGGNLYTLFKKAFT